MINQNGSIDISEIKTKPPIEISTDEK